VDGGGDVQSKIMQRFLVRRTMPEYILFVVLATLFRPSVSSDSTGFFSCLESSGIASDKIVQRSSQESPAYNKLNFQWQQRWSQIYPLAFIMVETEDEIVATVQCGRNYSTRVVPKSGGHSYEKYSFGDSSSVIVDVRNMSQILVSSDKKSVEVGPGTLLGPLQWTLWKTAQSFFPAGTYPYVGISGLATGGGHGAFTREHGLAVDHILEMNIVTADGILRTVNSDNEANLFWALRGGGGASFGIVTKFVFQLTPAPPTVYDGLLRFNITQFQEVFLAWQELAVAGPRNVMSLMGISGGTIEAKFWISLGEPDDFDKLSSQFPKPIGKSGQRFSYRDFLLAVANWEMRSDSIDLENLKPKNDKVNYLTQKAVYATRKLGRSELRQMQSMMVEMPSSISVSMDTYGGAVSDVGETETAFVHRAGRIALVGVVMHQPVRPSVDDVGEKWQTDFFHLISSFFEKKETYQNYPNQDFEDYLERYYGENLPRLIQVKNDYDPGNYFQNPQTVPTELPNSKSSGKKDFSITYHNSHAIAYAILVSILIK